MHRTQSQQFDSYSNRLVRFHREHGVTDARREADAPRAHFATLPHVAANPPRGRLALRLAAWMVLGLLAGLTFELCVVEPIARKVWTDSVTSHEVSR